MVQINGVNYEFGSIQVLLPSGLVMLCKGITYKDKIDGDVVTNNPGIPIDYSTGDYSGDCDLEVLRIEYAKINTFSAAKGGFYNMLPFPITVTLGKLGQIPQVDAFTVKFTERELGGKKGDKEMAVPLKGIIVSPIISNGVPAYLGANI